MKFRARIELSGKTATGIQVPAEVVAHLGTSKRPAVLVTINGHTYRSTVAPMGGVSMLPINAENRVLAHVSAGDEVEVEVEDLASLIKEAGGQASVFGRELNETAVGFAQAGTPG
jgi:Domain of unknown function (DUF1905)